MRLTEVFICLEMPIRTNLNHFHPIKVQFEEEKMYFFKQLNLVFKVGLNKTLHCSEIYLFAVGAAGIIIYLQFVKKTKCPWGY